jgi:hypothetical protein
MRLHALTVLLVVAPVLAADPVPFSDLPKPIQQELERHAKHFVQYGEKLYQVEHWRRWEHLEQQKRKTSELDRYRLAEKVPAAFDPVSGDWFSHPVQFMGEPYRLLEGTRTRIMDECTVRFTASDGAWTVTGSTEGMRDGQPVRLAVERDVKATRKSGRIVDVAPMLKPVSAERLYVYLRDNHITHLPTFQAKRERDGWEWTLTPRDIGLGRFITPAAPGTEANQ